MSNQLHRYNTPSLICIEATAWNICSYANIPMKVYDMIQMIAVRTLQKITFDVNDTRMIMIICFKIAFDFYEIEMDDNFWYKIGVMHYTPDKLQELYIALLMLFPPDAFMYLDQFLTPDIEKPIIQEQLNFWNEDNQEEQNDILIESKLKTESRLETKIYDTLEIMRHEDVLIESIRDEELIDCFNYDSYKKTNIYDLNFTTDYDFKREEEINFRDIY